MWKINKSLRLALIQIEFRLHPLQILNLVYKLSALLQLTRCESHVRVKDQKPEILYCCCRHLRRTELMKHRPESH